MSRVFLTGATGMIGSNIAEQLVGEIDQASLLDEAAQLDQVAGAFAPLHDPAPRISPTPCRFQTLDQRPVAYLRCRCRRQQSAHLCALAAERKRSPSRATPPSLPRSAR